MESKGDLGETQEIGNYTGRVDSGQVEPVLPTASVSRGDELLPSDGPDSREADLQTAIVFELSVALLADPPTELTMIRVDTEEGIVTLTGEVDNPKVRRIAGEIASSHPGVASAINYLEIHHASMDGQSSEDDEESN